MTLFFSFDDTIRIFSSLRYIYMNCVILQKADLFSLYFCSLLLIVKIHTASIVLNAHSFTMREIEVDVLCPPCGRR